MKVRIGPIAEYDESEKPFLEWRNTACQKCNCLTEICKLGGGAMSYCILYFYFYEKFPPAEKMRRLIGLEENLTKEESFLRIFLPEAMYLIGRIEENPILYDKLLELDGLIKELIEKKTGLEENAK